MTLSQKTLAVTESGSIYNNTTQTGGLTVGVAMTLLGQSQWEVQRPIGPIGMQPRQQRKTDSVGLRV